MSCKASKLIFCAASLIGVTAGAQPGQDASEASKGNPEPGYPSRVTVIQLDYADAEDVAAALSQVLPPTMSVVAYRPTNSLIIVADPVIVSHIPSDDE